MPDPTPTCPVCSTVMGPHGIEGQPMWLCDQCGSFAMGKDSFQHFVGADASSHTHKREDGVVHNCPGCGNAMAGSSVNGVEIDYCNSCNVVHADRSSFSLMLQQVDEPEELHDLQLQMDVERNLDNALRSTAAGSISNPKVDDIFVLFKNGILIMSYTTDVRDEMDKDVMASMMMAITDFVQSCFKGAGKKRALSSIRLEDKEIAFEHGTHLVVALTLKGTLDERTRKQVASKLADIEKKNAKLLGSWNGNLGVLSGVVKELDVMVGPLRS